ncbi:hypothetical protein BU24DRAFT_482395 [Aaosphaeria arxii CBS 175.79]|uniref:Uncharacterized protein n=1 Tax=Aaosphaeria arxii CBS 175.79 TaxID=1450172 RepID=A0A6A5XNM7_9PLEO|nr:uncharacterized protein BU24DRAFT_482395 [Aaosphaeria arxii CBS 175.79]KAF2014865.1 hypothetical protein BU24DRAFT_482395 [Aaosphaeria arxii CBS 175.79]
MYCYEYWRSRRESDVYLVRSFARAAGVENTGRITTPQIQPSTCSIMRRVCSFANYGYSSQVAMQPLWDIDQVKRDSVLDFLNSTLPGRFYTTVNQDVISLALRKVHDYCPSPAVQRTRQSRSSYPMAIKPPTQSGNKTFHIVAVDLPGFSFRTAATQPGLGSREMGVAFDAP